MATTSEVAAKILDLVQHAPAGGIFHHSKVVSPLDPGDGGASGDFIDSCDAYECFTFTLDVEGRTYHVTVEDITIKEDA